MTSDARFTTIVVPPGETYVPLNRRTRRFSKPRIVIFEGHRETHRVYGDAGRGLQRIVPTPEATR